MFKIFITDTDYSVMAVMVWLDLGVIIGRLLAECSDSRYSNSWHNVHILDLCLVSVILLCLLIPNDDVALI